MAIKIKDERMELLELNRQKISANSCKYGKTIEHVNW